MNRDPHQDEEKGTKEHSSFRDILNTSFSHLEEEYPEDEVGQCQKVTIDIEEPLSEDFLIKRAQSILLTDVIQEINEKDSKKLGQNEEGQSERQSQKVQDYIDSDIQEIKTVKEYQSLEEKYFQKIKIIYSLTILGSQKISPTALNRLKIFLFIPKHGEELVRWSNLKFGTQHTVLSALQRLQHIEQSQSQCQKLSLIVKQHFRCIIIILLCLVVIRLMI